MYITKPILVSFLKYNILQRLMRYITFVLN